MIATQLDGIPDLLQMTFVFSSFINSHNKYCPLPSGPFYQSCRRCQNVHYTRCCLIAGCQCRRSGMTNRCHISHRSLSCPCHQLTLAYQRSMSGQACLLQQGSVQRQSTKQTSKQWLCTISKQNKINIIQIVFITVYRIYMVMGWLL